MTDDSNLDHEKWRGSSTDSDWDNLLVIQAQANKDQTPDKKLNQICFACAAAPGAIAIVVPRLMPLFGLILFTTIATTRIMYFISLTTKRRSATLAVRFGAAVGLALCVASLMIYSHFKG